MQGQEKSEPERRPTARRPYVPPTLRELGSLQELTRGGSLDNRGEGPSISL